jgi:hypothetical protein
MPQVLDTTTPEAIELTRAIAAIVHGQATGSSLAAITTVLVNILLEIDPEDRDDASGCFAMTFHSLVINSEKFRSEMFLAELPTGRMN